MKNYSFNNWIISLFEKWDKEIRVFIKVIIFISIIGYIGYFTKFGYDFIETSTGPSFKAILYGVFFTILVIILFFVAHFSGGIDFNFRLIGVCIGLAVGGTSIGLIAGLIQNSLGWIIGGFFGAFIIGFTVKFYRSIKTN